MEPESLTLGQIVAYNLRRARELRGWSQEGAVIELEPYVGKRWHKAVYSAAERSVAGERVRHFEVDDLWAFSKAFDVPLGFFLVPPPQDVPIHHHGIPPDERADYMADFIDRTFVANQHVRARLDEAFDAIGREHLTRGQSQMADAVRAAVGIDLRPQLENAMRQLGEAQKVIQTFLKDEERQVGTALESDLPTLMETDR